MGIELSFRCTGRGQLPVRCINPHPLQARAPPGGDFTSCGICGRGGGRGGGREGVEPPFSRACVTGLLPRGTALALPCQCRWQREAGAYSPEPLEQIADLWSPMSLAPQNPGHGRWGAGQPQRVQEEGAG